METENMLKMSEDSSRVMIGINYDKNYVKKKRNRQPVLSQPFSPAKNPQILKQNHSFMSDETNNLNDTAHNNNKNPFDAHLSTSIIKAPLYSKLQ